ncbi:MAG: SGNH/GDSL hydrolase family protein [Alphaproteobacteria bacterium]|nr:SGNH/GDSL hydrolase family protein [Alphaproteobacteria bacterium]
MDGATQDHRSRATVAAVALAIAAVLSLFSNPVHADDSKSCAVPANLLRSPYPLPHVAARLALGEPVKVVALGSSSTEGVGASSTAASYPSQFQAELQRLWPRNRITVVNKGVSGEQSQQMVGRFERDVIAEKPDLLIWQTGTNSALHDGDIERFVAEVDWGLDRAREAGIDVLLMTPQFSPRFEKVRNKTTYLHNLATIGAVNGTPVLRRYEMMKHWLDSGQMTPEEMINSDGLHLTDRSYHCLGVAAARMVVALATAPAKPIPAPALTVSVTARPR